jgi:hypothetical protein
MCQCDYKIDLNPSSIKLYILPALTVNSVGNINFNIDVHSNLGVPDTSQLVILCHPLWSHFLCLLVLLF